jgi:hypothetical protein
MRISSTIATKTFAATSAVLVVLLIGIPAAGQNCSQGKGLTSNDIRWLAGSGDTLWMITERGQELALNLIEGAGSLKELTLDSTWKSFSLGCRKVGINDIHTGGGFTVASFDTAPNVIWTYEHSTEKTRDYTLPWPEDSIGRQFTVNDMVLVSGNYFFACLDGGVVQWNLQADQKTVLFPGTSRRFNLSNMQTSDLPAFDTTRRVTGIEVPNGDSLLIIVTPSRLWSFSLVDSTWDSSITTAFSDAAIAKPVFEYLFINNLDRSTPLFCIVTDADDGDEGAQKPLLCKYNRSTRRWDTMFDQSPKALTFGHHGFMYALFDEQRPGTTLRNIVRAYRDTLGDSGFIHNPDPVINDATIHSRMTGTEDIDVPEIFNDILYSPRSDSSGYLWIATSEGLFLSPDENPGSPASAASPFILIKRAPSLSTGLKKTYARPGILTPTVTNCKFIYNLKADRADVTIKVYDYNMDHVKTVIEKRPRVSGTQGGPLGRSTVESEDNWNGTNEQGRPVAPGVYYYKITTSSGERAFGKIIVAR